MVDDSEDSPTLHDTSGADTRSITQRAPRTDLAGSPLGGYELGAVLGRGGMGEVVAAHDLELEREVALKRMRDGAPEPDAIARFVREAKIQARLDHPAIVPVHELGRDAAGLPYFTMKRLAGTTLADRLKTSGPIQPLLRAFADVCFAIELAHTRGVVHRDLKPSNIMLGDYGEVYVLDWGVARVIALDDPGPAAGAPPNLPIAAALARGDSQLADTPVAGTATGALLGTPGYMAPEQLRGENVGPPADVYSLGAILFEVLAGATLHPPGNAAIVSTLYDEADRSPAACAPGRAVPPELDAACRAALAQDPAERPTARALATRVQAYLDGDRDLDRRRALAESELVAARTALASGDRVAAIRLAGRALALDPQSKAAELVASLVLTPTDVPADALRDLEGDELEVDQARGLRGTISYLGIWALAPLVAILHVTSWPLLGALIAGGTVMAGLVTLRARGRFPMWALIACNAAYLVLFSRLGGPFLLTPLLACAIATAIGTHTPIAQRRGIAVAALLAMIVLPIALEALGVLAPTWWMNDGAGGGLISRGAVFDGRTRGDAIAMILGTCALAAVVTIYTLAMNRARLAAQRRAQIQAWHLKQLLPPAAQ